MEKSNRERTDKMRKCKVKRFKNKGFTLVEMLVVLLIVMTITSLFPMIFSVLSNWIEKPSSLHPFEWEVATSQLLMEIREASEVRIQNGNLQLIADTNQMISYELYGNMLRRRINSTGHEVIIQQIRTVHFSLIKGGVYLLVTDEDGTEYKKFFYRWNDVMQNE
ncbi:competence type IV pilus minor pilin ComGF [Bacillus sp. DJP31]|uniref:competence type IV pilus minor pilin ComGF n=1 Tax=Bacillus sp. DJP31 TaxID=3409789 RepID=UPI003BB5CF05